MKLEVKKLEDNKYLAKFAKEELEININSEVWNIEGINKFLIKLSTSTPKNDDIEIIYDQEITKEDKVYLHLYNLFKEFVDEYNKLNLEE